MRKSKKEKLSDYLVENGYFQNNDEIIRAVIAGEVLVDEVVATSAAQKVSAKAAVRVKGRKRFVSRGGEKLQGAIDAFSVDVSGMRCIDVGSSTGGFTDCLLQADARSVACVDVNYGQLAWQVRSDPRVTVFERTNIKTADPAGLGAPFDLIVIDVSFIGLAQLAPTLAALATRGTQLLALVKPQFESKRGETEGGVVMSEDVRLRTVDEVRAALHDNGFETLGVVESPIKGPAGNIEYLIHAIVEEEAA